MSITPIGGGKLMILAGGLLLWGALANAKLNKGAKNAILAYLVVHALAMLVIVVVIGLSAITAAQYSVGQAFEGLVRALTSLYCLCLCTRIIRLHINIPERAITVRSVWILGHGHGSHSGQSCFNPQHLHCHCRNPCNRALGLHLLLDCGIQLLPPAEGGRRRLCFCFSREQVLRSRSLPLKTCKASLSFI